MTRDGKSSSGDGSSPNETVFDIASEHGMLQLLRAIHRGPLKQKEKNELRDQIFALTQGEKTKSEKVIKVFAEAGFTVVFGEQQSSEAKEVKEVVSAPATHVLGRSRMQPRFSAPMAPLKSPEPPSMPTKSDESKGGSSTPAPAEEKKPEPEPVREPKIEMKEPSAPSTSEPQAEPVVEVPTSTEPEPVVKPEAKPEPTPDPMTGEPKASEVSASPKPTAEAAAEVPAPAAPVENPMERIKEIKRIVHQKVGNPIALIDTDNTVGREYMNALLAAMKSATGGRPEEVAAAMQRLELAFQAAIKVAENTPPAGTAIDEYVKSTTPPVTGYAAAAPEPVASRPVMPEPAVTAVAQEPVTSEQPSVVSPVSPVPEPTRIAVTSAEHTAPPASTPGIDPVITTPPPDESLLRPQVGETGASFIPPRNPNNRPRVAPLQSAAPTPVPSSVETAPAALVTPTSSVPSAPQSSLSSNSTRLMSVAKEEQLQNLMRQNQVADIEAQKQQDAAMRANTDPIMLPEVTAGLKQLLSEWGLFKSSGFFGTGPGGIDHPLYKKLQALTMSAVIAGRFEGATPQIKQSITDYMNGWRYEEGIVHEHTETFEHYLRRVIRHILDNKDAKAAGGQNAK